jgi:hypothetical protein
VRVIVLALAMLLTACAADAPVAHLDDSAGLCARLAAFGRSVPQGQARSVTLSGEGLLGTQTCERGVVTANPGGATLCGWWVVNSSREFFGQNFLQIVDCLLAGRKVVQPDVLQYSPQSIYVHSGYLALMSVPNIDENLAVEVTYNAPERVGAGVVVQGLRVTFTKNAGR